MKLFFCPWIELIEKYKKINRLESPINMPMEVFTVELGNQEDINTKKFTFANRRYTKLSER
ncbi:MAG: hypothetical protein IRD7MM_04475 [Candidatus Midichloria mitochondrii]|nr:hypothetical protein [Candidatus Midichloria mitochondrii]MDJ1298657.1 hypothetical protein [Candidatus Midichloria mitochondrii]